MSSSLIFKNFKAILKFSKISLPSRITILFISAKNYAKLDLKLFCSCTILLGFFNWSHYVFSNCRSRNSKSFPCAFLLCFKDKMIIEVPLFQEISLALNNSWLCVCRGYFCNTVIHKFFDDKPVRYDLYCFILSFFSMESILLHYFVFVLLFLSLAYLGPSRNINDGVF